MKKHIVEWKLLSAKLSNLLSIGFFEDLVLSQDQDSEKKLHDYIVKRNIEVEN